MESYNKITRLHKCDKHVLHKYGAEFFEFSPESITGKSPKESDILSLSGRKNTTAYVINSKLSL